MPDVANFYCEDWWQKKAAYSFYLPADSAGTQVEDLRDLLSATADAKPYLAEQVITRYGPVSPFGVKSTTGHIYDACALQFTTSGAEFYVCYFLGPNPGCFNPDGSVDDTYGPLADLIAWLLANAVTPEGDSLTLFSEGWKALLTPGWVDLSGATEYVSRSGLVADFNREDGAEVRVADE